MGILWFIFSRGITVLIIWIYYHFHKKPFTREDYWNFGLVISEIYYSICGALTYFLISMKILPVGPVGGGLLVFVPLSIPYAVTYIFILIFRINLNDPNFIIVPLTGFIVWGILGALIGKIISLSLSSTPKKQE